MSLRMREQLLAISLALSALPSVVCAQGVSVTVRLAAPDALDVSFALPAACTELPFLKNGTGAQAIRKRWLAQDDCGAASAETLKRKGPACVPLRFRVPVTSDKISGYPGGFPTGQAVYVHMSNYALGTQCGPVHYRFAAPGSIAAAGARFEGEAPAHADASALLFPARWTPEGQDLDYFDPALSAAAVAQIRHVAKTTAHVLQAAMPHAVMKRPILAATLAREPGGPNIGGSAGDVLLLSLFNWPATPGPEEQRKMNKLVAHEVSHGVQLRDAVDVYRDARLIHEGGAEFLRWTVSLREGWLTPRQAADELDDALAACMLGTGNRSWRASSQGDTAGSWLEYSCGLPAYVYALAARQGKGAAYARLDDFYQQLRAGATPDFAQAIECGASACTARVLPAILDRDGPMRTQWAAALDQTGLARPRAPTQSQTDTMMLQALAQLTMEDCGGKKSMTPTRSSVLIDTLPMCQGLRADVDVLRVEGHPVFGGALALPAMVDACASRHAVALGLKDGATLTLACRVPYQVTARMYGAEIDKIMQALARE
jgi:hypothetical protein